MRNEMCAVSASLAAQGRPGWRADAVEPGLTFGDRLLRQ